MTSELMPLVETANQLLGQAVAATLDERELLRQRTLDGFSECVENKNRLLQALQDNVSNRAIWLQQHGCEQGRAGHLQAAQQEGCPEAMEGALGQMDELLSAFKQATEVNALIVGRSLALSKQTLDIIKGHRKDRQVYNQSGKAAHHAANQVIGKA